MMDFWVEHSHDASLEEMMLDTNATELTKRERPEILSYLPDWSGKDVVELGAGIGRFTGELAATANTVLAVDFMETFINKNRQIHANFNNVEYNCIDVTKLNRNANSSDLVFSNWLLMYLEDKEVHDLILRMLSWIREGGYLFVRESCNRQSGEIRYFLDSNFARNKKRSDNPTKYRESHVYMALFTLLTIPTEHEDEVFGFELVLSRPVKSYITMKQNEDQVVFLLQKLRRKAGTGATFRTFKEFLDNQQYTTHGILRYEKIFGWTFVSTGGLDTTKELVSQLDLKPGQLVLDVGCGIGGSAFYMVKEFGANVFAIDLSSNMINLGLQRAKEVGVNEEKVQFEIADATKRVYKVETFDVIYSRDTIRHIHDKLSLFKKFYRWLKPGGKLLISDYCCSDGEHTETFRAYVQQRGYSLLSPRDYGQVLEAAGFSNVDARDRTDLFIKSLQKELVKTENIKTEFIQEFSEEDYDYIVRGWSNKLSRTDDQKWGVFYAEKK